MIFAFHRRVTSLIASSVLVLFLLSNFLFFPRWQYSVHAFSVKEEREVGEKLLSIVRKEFRLLDDPDITQYINRLGKEILAVAGPQYFDYHFFVVKNKEFNAFAAPSGLLFFHSGLIETMTSEGELLSVIAHECAHVTSRHIAERIQKNTKLTIGTAALLLAGIAMGGGALSEALITGSLAANASMNLSFSRKAEEEADRLAFTWMQSKKRDPAEMESMLRKMRKISQYRRGKLPPYLLTHPEPARRLGYVQDLIQIYGEEDYIQRDTFEFLRFKHRVLTLSKDPMTLMPRYQNRISKAGGDIMAHYGLSHIYLRNAEFTKAMDSLRTVMNAYPDKTILTTDMGIILFQAGRYKDALKRFEKAHGADPACLYTSYYLARTLEQLGEHKKALSLYKELLTELPEYSPIYYRIGSIKAQEDKKAEGFYYLGIHFFHEGDHKTARYHLKHAIEKLPADSELKKKARETLERIKRIEKS